MLMALKIGTQSFNLQMRILISYGHHRDTDAHIMLVHKNTVTSYLLVDEWHHERNDPLSYPDVKLNMLALELRDRHKNHPAKE